MTHLNMNAHAQKEFIHSSEPVAGFYDTLVKIGHGVWIGDSVIILPNVSIGNGAVIGAGSIVTKDIPPFAVAVGNPAKVIKYRFNQKIRDKLNDVQWWHWSEAKVKLNKPLFEADFSQLSEEECMAMLGKIRES
ncbi:MAG: CatB-related O-acetyltransferase [Aestuariibacter sp.]